MAELWDVYDQKRQKTGRKMMRGQPIPEGDYHFVVDIWIMNGNGELLLQRRSMEKETAPGMWCCTGGAAVAGETSAEACIREMTEELGVPPDMNHAEIVIENTKRNCHKDVWFIRQDIAPEAFHLQKEEVEEVRWVSLVEFDEMRRDATIFWQLSYLNEIVEFLKQWSNAKEAKSFAKGVS